MLGNYEEFDQVQKKPIQVHKNYIMVQIKSGIIFIDQHQAHVRILYEKYLHNLKQSAELVQKQLFPITINIAKDKVSLFTDILPQMQSMGFEIQSFGGEAFIAVSYTHLTLPTIYSV